MRLTRKTIGAGACLSLLMLQLSGLHVHADEHGYVGVPETSYSHKHGHDHHGPAQHELAGTARTDGESPPPDHDYDDARDVSVLELALGIFKLTLAILVLVFLLAILPRVRMLVGTDFVYPILSGRHTRWRPPLRAPPRLATI